MMQAASRTKWQRLWAESVEPCQDILNTNTNLPIVPSSGFPTRMLDENEVYPDLVLDLTCATILHPEVKG